ncbi:MAG: hypothetical protein WED09_10510 [Homoserinimonas sp.]
MDETERSKKRIEEFDEKAATEHPAASSGVAVGTLKGRPLEPELTGRVKPSVADATKQAAQSDREVGRRDLPLPPEADREAHEMDSRSLGLRLEVSGDRITVLDSLEVDVPVFMPEQVRGTDFLAVQASDEILAIKPLVDPGIAVGIPDPNDTEFRGHREIVLDAYELTVLLPLDAIERLTARDLQGAPDRTDQPSSAVEIVMYRSAETSEIQPRRQAAIWSRDDLEVVASSGQLTLDSLRGTGWADVNRRRDDVKPRPEQDDLEE